MDNKPSKQQIEIQGKQAFKRMMDYEQNKGWEKYDSKPCDMYKMQIDGRTASKGEIYKFLAHPPSIKLLNSQVNKAEEIEMIQQTLRIQIQGYDGIWPVAGRDFIMVTCHDRKQNKIYLSSKSINYPYPEVKKVVRAQLFIGGYILQKISDTQTKVTYISDSDVKGSVPTMIKNQVTKRQGSLAGKIEEQMKKSYKK